MSTVTIVGAGLMGTAIATPLADNGHMVRLVGTHLDGDIIASCKEKHFHPRLKRALPPNVTPYCIEEIAQGLEGAEIIVSGVSSPGAHWIGQALAPHIKPGQMIIGVTKGLEATSDGKLTILPDVLASELPASIRGAVTFSAVGGPCIAGELAARRQSCVMFGSRDGSVVEKLASVFRTSYYHIWTTTELVGLEYGVALKNAYALAVGLASGMLDKQGGPDDANAYMHNTAAAIFAQGCTEMERILRAAGAPGSFAYGLPGAGDLYVTSAGGRTVRLGALLGKGHSYREAREIMVGETLEAVEIIRAIGAVLPRMTRDGQIGPDELPLMRALVDIVVYGKSVDIPFDAFWSHLRCG